MVEFLFFQSSIVPKFKIQLIIFFKNKRYFKYLYFSLQLVPALHQMGVVFPEIAAQIGCTVKNVRHWVRTYQAGGDESLRDHRQFNCRPRLTIADEDDEIRDYVVNGNPFASSVEMRNDMLPNILPWTVRRPLFDINFLNDRSAKKTALTQAHRDERMCYALQYMLEPVEIWNNVICIDEKTFSSSDDGRRLVW